MNHISYLETETGVRVDKHENMCGIFMDYFANIFAGNQWEEALQQNSLGKFVTEEQNRKLVAEVPFKESSVAIKQMHLDKASRLNGLNPAFFLTILVDSWQRGL